MQPIVDYIIVGQGIAGSVLALQLEKEGASALIIDDGAKHTSSKTAAGLWNPIVFKNLEKGWNADELLCHVLQFFPEAQHTLNHQFYHEKPLVKRFSDFEEWNDWDVKMEHSSLSKYLYKETVPNIESTFQLAMPEGYGKVRNTGYVQVPEFLKATKHYFESKDGYLSEEFDHNALILSSTTVSYKQLQAKSIVFCEGTKAKENPLTSHIRIQPTKGQVLVVYAPDLDTDYVFNGGGVFVQPLGKHTFRLGSTFEWKMYDALPNEEGIQHITEKFEKLYKGKYTVVGHYAANRPTTPDRRPYIGKLKNHNAYLFNGLGTKGILNAPYCAHHLTQHLIHQATIPKEIDLYRFRKPHQAC